MAKRRTTYLPGINGSIAVPTGSNSQVSANPITGNIGASTGVGGGVNVGASANPITGSVGANVGGIKPVSGVTVGAGVGVGPSGVGVTPSIQIGDSSQAQTGGQIGGTVGGIAGAAVGGPVGAAVGAGVGSATGSAIAGNPVGAGIGAAIGGPVGAQIGGALLKNIPGLGGNNSVATKEHKARNKVSSAILGSNSTMVLPDGTTADYSTEGQHTWKYGDKRVDNQGDRHLHEYETDYTNDMDYVAGMGGTTLARLLAGGKDKAIDQVGQLIGNKSLGRVGYGAEFNQDNFNTVATNLRATYAQKGIKSKDEMLSLANKAFADGRIDDADYAAAKQTADMMFDGGYNTAAQLMSGRWAGIKTANQQPSNAVNEPLPKGVNSAGLTPEELATAKKRGTNNYSMYSYSPVLSADEAMASVQPLIDLYKQNYKEGYDFRHDKTLAGASSVASGLALASGIYGLGNKLTGGAIGDVISNLFKGAGQSLGGIAGEIKDYLNPPASVAGEAPYVASDAPGYFNSGDAPYVSADAPAYSGGDVQEGANAALAAEAPYVSADAPAYSGESDFAF